MKILVIIFVWCISFQVIYGQLSFSEKRQRDKALDEAISLISQEQYELAAAKLTQCLDLDSAFAPAYMQRGRVFIEWGLMEDALIDLDMALQYDASMGEAYFYKAYIFFGSDTTGTDAQLFELAISNGFNNPWAYYFRGLTRVRDEMDGMAMNDFSKAIELKTGFALAHHERAGIKRRTGDLQGAHFDYQTAIEYQPVFPMAYNNRGSVKILLGDYEGAIEDYSHALEQDPGLFIALNNRGYARYYLGYLEEALQDFDNAIAMNEHFSQAVLNKASLLAGMSEVQPALKLMDGILEEHPGEALLYLNRGLIRELTGDLNGACEDWTRAKELGAEEADEYIKECSNL